MTASLVQAWREATGRSKEEAARHLVVSHRMIDYYETGERPVSRRSRELILRDLAERGIRLDRAS